MYANIFAATFSVLPKGNLPTTVPLFGKTSAYYTITNKTDLQLNDNFVKTLPDNVAQVTCDPKYCGMNFNLGANGTGKDSCVLKLTIKGPVKAELSNLLVCSTNGTTCDGTFDPLNVKETKSMPFVGVDAGGYSDQKGGFFPLLAATNDSGETWSYPHEIFTDLKNIFHPDFSGGFLANSACTTNLCIAPGQWCSGPLCERTFPLVAVGTQNATLWKYPASIYENLQTRIDSNLTGGYLGAGACFGTGNNGVCIATGTYFSDPDLFYPLLALSSDGGKTWSYPSSIFKNLTTSVDPDFVKGTLVSASCTKSTCKSVCISAGNFCTTSICNLQIPLVALSTDKGKTWSYPSSIFNNLKSIDPTFESGTFVSSSCTGEGEQAICVAAGNYSNGPTILPLLALTRDGGNTWTYPPSILEDLATKIGHGFRGGLFTGVSCSGSGKKAVCTAAGAYFRTSGANIPFLAISRDGGETWSYPDFIYTKLKTLVDSDFVGGVFDGTSCIGTGKDAICTAAGNYCDKNQICYPLLALSTNGGKTWSYPPSVYKNLPLILGPGFTRGFFNNVSCSGIANHNFCSAAGQFLNVNGEAFPLAAISTDSGNTWSYPSYIFQNLTTTIDPDFSIGTFNKIGTSETGFVRTT